MLSTPPVGGPSALPAGRLLFLHELSRRAAMSLAPTLRHRRAARGTVGPAHGPARPRPSARSANRHAARLPAAQRGLERTQRLRRTAPFDHSVALGGSGDQTASPDCPAPQPCSQQPGAGLRSPETGCGPPARNGAGLRPGAGLRAEAGLCRHCGKGPDCGRSRTTARTRAAVRSRTLARS